jgi:threonine dehydrogenase-like Zn-dependent dehydrogenase
MTAALSIHHVAPEKVSVVAKRLPAVPADHVLIRTRYSAISAGTESLIYRGLFPASSKQDSTIASLQGSFEYPFAYGYSLVGEVIEIGAGVDPVLQDQQVFAFHPHQDHAIVPLCDVLPIPAQIDARAALFLPNMESAINFVMDASPVIGERAMVFGLGVVGLLTTALLAEFPLSALITADPIAMRRQRSLELGAGRTVDPVDCADWNALEKNLSGREPAGLDLAIELSGNTDALNRAIALCGFTGRVVVGSWYGREAPPFELGTHFHRNRIRIVSSQVSTVDPQLSGRWTKARRIALAWDAIERLGPQRLITHSLPFRDCQRAFDLASRREDGVLQVVLDYS